MSITSKMEAGARVLKHELETRTGQPWHCYLDHDHFRLRTEQGVGVDGHASVSTSPGSIYINGWYSKEGAGSIQFIHLNLSSRIGDASVAGAVTVACMDGQIEAAYAAAVAANQAEADRKALEGKLRGIAACIKGTKIAPEVKTDGTVTIGFYGMTQLDAEKLLQLVKEYS